MLQNNLQNATLIREVYMSLDWEDLRSLITWGVPAVTLVTGILSAVSPEPVRR